MTNIPTEDEFERASKFMEERSRHLDTIRDRLKMHFSKLCPLYDFYILPQRDVNYRAYVLFEKENDIDSCKRNGIVEQIKEFIFDELERYRKEKRENITVAFELDSNENVILNFEGDYFLRLR